MNKSIFTSARPLLALFLALFAVHAVAQQPEAAIGPVEGERSVSELVLVAGAWLAYRYFSLNG